MKRAHESCSIPTCLRISTLIVSALTFSLSAANAASGAPPQTHDTIDVQAKSSSIVVPITISLADLQAEANAQIPTTLYTINQSQDACVPAQWIDKCIIPRPFSHGCIQHLKTKVTPEIDCHLDGTVTRRSLTVGGSGANLSLSTPIDISVTASGRGDIGKHIHQTASADMIANASVAFDVDENWLPKATVNTNYSWTDPPHVWILGFKITFADKVDPKIHDFIAQLQQKLPSMLDKLNIKGLAQKYWDAGFTTLRVSDSPPVWLSLSPQSVGYGGYQIANGALNLTFMADGLVKASVGPKPDDSNPTPLPKLQRSSSATGFDFDAPISVDYGTLRDQLATALKFGQEQTLNMQTLGTVKVTIRNVSLYQTDGKSLAVGIDLDASPSVGVVTAKGTVWLTTKVKIDNATRTVIPDEFSIYGKEGNGPLDLLVSLVQLPPLNGLLKGALKYDFSAQYDKLIGSANGALRRQITPEIYIDGKVASLTAEGVHAGPDGITAIVDARGSVSIHSGKLP